MTPYFVVKSALSPVLWLRREYLFWVICVDFGMFASRLVSG
jgi:hypothetical protein